MKKYIIFSTTSYSYLMEELLAISSFEKGQIERHFFPDGELYLQILNDVENKDVILIGGTIDDMNTLELYDLAMGIVQLGARSLQIIIPYFGYSTMERAVKKGEIVKAKNRATLLSAIPMCTENNVLYLMDLHSEGIPHYFDHHVRTHHIYCKDIFINEIKNNTLVNVVLAATDAGRAKWVESLAFEMNIGSAFVYKHRLQGDETVITGVNANVQNKTVYIYDDMIRTGGSLIKAAQAYHDAGAKEIIAMTTHGLFNNGALEKIEKSGLFTKVITTNTHPNVLNLKNQFIQIKSVAGIIFEIIH
ncbi:MAG: ribose-phosphate diphosphokinase [Chitinophagaceae bacterium]